MNKVKFGVEARGALLSGASTVYHAVSSTLGASGRNVVRQKFGRPAITNDGVTVARAIDIEEPFERQGADLLKEAAERTVKEAGDGTTTSIVLAYCLFKEGLELVASGMNPMSLRNSIEKETGRIIAEVRKRAIQIRNKTDLEDIARISVENAQNGKLIAESVSLAGKDGLVLVEESAVPGVSHETVNGYRFDRGLENAYLATDYEKGEAVLENKDKPVPVLIADKQWNLIQDLSPLIDALKKRGDDKLLVIAEEISGELMSFITLNRIQLRFHAVPVKIPFNKDMLEDIAALCGATALTKEKGIVTPKIEHLGYAKKVVVSQRDTTVIARNEEAVEKRASELREQIKNAEHDFEKEKLRERLSKLKGKTVIIKVGASTEAELKYLVDKIDDGIAAVTAAVDEGVCAGGGMTLFRIAKELYSGDDVLSRYFSDVLCAPMNKILANSGIEEVEKVVEELSQSETSGYDAEKREVVKNIVSSGIIDPVKVTCSALKNAASLAAMLLTVETVIAEIHEKGDS